MNQPLRRVPVLAIALVAGFAALGEALPQEPPSLYVVLDLVVPGAPPTSLAVQDGEVAVYADRELGFSIGVRPRITDIVLGLVTLEVLNVEAALETTVSFTEGQAIDDISGVLRRESFIALDDGLLLEARIRQFASDPWNPLGFDRPQCQRTVPGGEQHRNSCCVTANGTVACATTARLAASSCCAS